MNSNQRSQENNQSDNGANEKSLASRHGGTADKDNLNQSQQSGTLNGSPQQQGGSMGAQESTERAGSRTGAGEQQQGRSMGARQSTGHAGSQSGASQQQGMQQDVHESNDLAGGMPRSPAGNRQSADMPMDDDTGLSNKPNQTEVDEGSRQEKQSNVGRRSDMTPD